MIRVVVADDHDIVRTGLRLLLADAPDMELAGDVPHAHQLVALAERLTPDVVVLDIHMDGCHGPRTVRALRELPRPPAVVIFTMCAEDTHAVGYLRAGASAFIGKRRSSGELLDAIRAGSKGRRYITPTLAEHLFAHQIDLTKPPQELLSPRESEVVRLLADGLRATDIAQRMAVRASTVNTFVQRIKTKLGVRTAVEIVQVARELGLLG